MLMNLSRGRGATSTRPGSPHVRLRFEPLEQRRLLALTPYSLPIQGTQQFVPAEFTQVGDEVFFQVDFNSARYNLWKTDGTPQGTQEIDNSAFSNTETYGYLTEFNDELFFSGRNRELWRSDGTEAGTVNVQDIDAWYLVNRNGTLFFSDGEDLWKSDGTTAGTVLVKEVGLVSHQNNYPRELTTAGGTLFFIDNDDVNGAELWKSDGTDAGTVMVKDIRPGTSGFNLSSLTDVNGTLFFAANDGSNGVELWKSDGTEAGTVMVADLNLGAPGSSPANLVNVGGTLFFRANDGTYGAELWKSDGTEAGTVLVVDTNPGAASSNPGSMTNVNGVIFFSANSTQLWKTDGTALGSQMVANIWTSASGGGPSNLANINGTLFFRANDGTHGRELWRTDGTLAGTAMVADLRLGANESLPDDFFNFNGSLMFSASGTGLFENFQPWVLPSVALDLNGGGTGNDYTVNWFGTPTVIVDSTAAAIDSTGATLGSMTATISEPELGDLLTADTSDTAISASFDGTTLTLSGVDSVANYRKVLRSIAYDSTASPWVLFKTVTIAAVNELGGIHQTAVSTIFVNQQPVVDLNGAAAGIDNNVSWVGTSVPITSPDAVVFDPDSPNLASLEILLLDPEVGDILAADTTGTSIVASFDGSMLLLSGTDTVAHYEQVLRTVTYNFANFNPQQASRLAIVWATDTAGLTSGAALLSIDIPVVVDLNGQATGTAFNRAWTGDPVTIADSSAFVLVPGGLNVELLTVDLVDPEPSDVLAADTSGTNITAEFAGGTLLLSGTDTRANYQQVLRTITYDTGATEATAKAMLVTVYDSQSNASEAAVATIDLSLEGFLYLLKDIYPNSGGSNAGNYVAVDGLTYFVANDGTSGQELWKSDGSLAGTVRVKDLNPGPSSAYISELTNVGGTLFFTGTDGPNFGLWKSDGTQSGTVLVKDVAAQSLINVGGTLLFVGGDHELWRSDGTESGTVLVKDISSDGGSDPRYFETVGGTLFFVAQDPLHGSELWKSDGTEAGTVLVKDIRVGPQSAFAPGPFFFTELENVNGLVYFRADDGVNGESIWKSDGTETGTVFVVDNPNPPLAFTSFWPHHLTNVNGTLFFAAQYYLFGIELFKLNGDAVVLAADLRPGEGLTDSLPDQLTAVGDDLYFTAHDSTDFVRDLFRINAASGPAVLLKEGGQAAELTGIGDRLFFRASDAAHGFELWQTDGTPAGTKLTADILPGSASSNPSELTAINGVLFFTALDAKGNEPRVLRLPGSSTGITGRSVFYNNSSFDADAPGTADDDDQAIATDKTAYLPGQGVATFANVTSYSRGINGLMVDVFNPSSTIGVGDFTFKMGNNNTPSSWIAAPAPSSLVARPGAGVGGADRFEIMWNDGQIANTWLQVIVEGDDAIGNFNANTSLAASDVFFFGSRIGDAGNDMSPTVFVTSAADEIAVRSATPAFGLGVTNALDFDKNGALTAVDQIAARNNSGFLFRLNIASPPPPPLPASASGDASMAVATALSISVPPIIEQHSPHVSTGQPPREAAGAIAAAAHPTEAMTSRSRAIVAAADAFAFEPTMDDELLGSLSTDRLLREAPL